MNIVVTGSLGYDYIMDFSGRFADRIMPDKIHKISLSFLVDKFAKQFGGTAGNIAYTLKLLGVEPLILSTAGNDFAPYAEFMQKHSIITDYIKQVADEPTGSYFVTTDQDDNQIGAFYTGAMKYNTELSIADVKEQSDFVVISPHIPYAMMKTVSECKSKNIPYLFDPAFQIEQFSKEELVAGISGAEIVIGNDYEIDLILKKTELTKYSLIKSTKVLVTTLGHKGSMIETNDKQVEVTSAKPENATDPTGAGDAYRAGFIAGYLHKFDLQTCGQMGAVAAAYSVETYGTQTHTFTKEEFTQRYQDNFGSKLNI